jgi:nucleotide sugar dehydrogenase
MIKNIGIIGRGFVGTAVASGFNHSSGYDANIRIFDVDTSRSTHTLLETINSSEIIFISVPTPAKKDGSIDLGILKNLLNECNELIKDNSPIFLVRSTVVPGTCQSFNDKFKNLNIVFNPEFLTERSAHFDFINQSRVILGGEPELTKHVKDLYQDRFGEYLPVIETNFQTAELIKYMNNLFFATKVSFMNEMKVISDKVDADWQKAVEGFILDGRIGHSHIQVPGPDGKYGFGGSCFPKDIQALISFCNTIGVEPHVLNGAWERNLEVRSERDWEQLKGRAVSDND